MKKVLLVIPAYNEEENILKTYNSILLYNKSHKTNFDVIVINDGSRDNTEMVLNQNNVPHITLIHNLGIGGAVQTGYKYAYQNNYDIAIQFDGDGQHDVNYVSKIIEPLLNGKAMMSIGSRFVDSSSSEFKSTKARQIGIKLISSFIKFFTGEKIYDVTSGFRAIDRSLIDRFSKEYPLEYPEPISTTEILKEGCIVSEVPVSMNERTGGVSSIRSWKNVYYMLNVLLSIVIIGLRRKK
ncbi:glycosyl transferase family 2 [Faecalitalea cylindroides]|uniref:Glycosyl transferase family 2 n=1 Tax=Faecalitalea cylindroides TaxID=39483 RepID=A0A1Y4LQL5_9FIRM|nr:glycosyltransferase family 2 protein [Faecalitalea cylindroides]OUP58974.1 glycosyl transferase family 2 [Faecalitalea cylindroides]